MTRHVALLRAVNVGDRRLPMTELQTLLGTLQCTNVRTHLQSGNAVFDSDSDTDVLQAAISDACRRRFGFTVPTIVRDQEHIASLIDAVPFEVTDDRLLHIGLFNGAIETCQESNARDAFIARPEAVYVKYRDASHDSQYNLGYFERRFGCVGTMRNLNTMRAITSL